MQDNSVANVRLFQSNRIPNLNYAYKQILIKMLCRNGKNSRNHVLHFMLQEFIWKYSTI